MVVVYNPWGGENGPVTVAAFKADWSISHPPAQKRSTTQNC